MQVVLWISVWLLSVTIVSGGRGGLLRPSVLLTTQENRSPSATAPPPPASTEIMPSTQNDGSHISSTLVWITIVGVGAFVVLVISIAILVIAILRFRWRAEPRVTPWKPGMMSRHLPGGHVFETLVPFLQREELQTACEDFSNIIGSSPDGVVYKGTLSTGVEIAAMSIRASASDWSPHFEVLFRRKVEGLARMKHKHLVNLIAYCSDEEPFTRMLVFEYASNGTLAEHLHNVKESEHLDWPTRMRVIMGAAYALEHMHHDLVPPASHLNFDASAIYLTDDYAAKLANFGLAKMLVGGSHEKSKSFWSGTWSSPSGYHCNAEWESESEAEPASDHYCPGFESNMYSFGVFLLEVISGRLQYFEPEGSLVDWAVDYLYDPKMVQYLVDPTLKTHNPDELAALCKIVIMCLSNRGYRRPSMRKVTQMLSDVLKLTPKAATSKVSPLLWAQLEILDNS